MVALHWEKYMQHAREKYNKEHLLQLPLITRISVGIHIVQIWQILE